MKITHLGHSSFLVELGNIHLLFDYYNQNKSFVPPERCYVFNGHSHYDHYNSEILKWHNVKFILSDDIQDTHPNALKVAPDQSYQLDDLIIKTYPSTDLGVAFSIFTQNKHIYFASDNAFWNWENKQTSQDYIDQVLEKIDKTPIDLAFHVCDARLRSFGAGGIFIFAEYFKPRLLVPMHNFGKFTFNNKAAKQITSCPFWNIQSVGESLELDMF